MPATSDLLNRPCVSEDMAKLAHHRYVQSDLRAAFLDGVRAQMQENRKALSELRDALETLIKYADLNIDDNGYWDAEVRAAIEDTVAALKRAEATHAR